MRKKKVIVLVLFLIISITGGVLGIRYMTQSPMQDPDTISYVPLGDSFTIGEGVREKERYPNLLVQHLNESGIAIKLVANPAVTGYTTEELIEYELPVFEKYKPSFTTILIGANDIAYGISPEQYRQNIHVILSRVLEIIPAKRCIVLTIPDFSVTPLGQRFNETGTLRDSIQEYNTILKEEAKKRNIAIVDLFEMSGELSQKEGYVIDDGLHPSGQQYKAWEEEIYPVAFKALKE